MALPSTLAPFYAGWDNYQRLLVETVAPLNAAQLALQAAPPLRPIWHLVAHICTGRIGWFHRTLGEGDASLTRFQSWTNEGMPARDAAELTDGLVQSWRLIESCLHRWTPGMLDEPFRTPTGQPVTRQWVIWHVLEHDLHHGGELHFSLGLHGITPPSISYRAQPGFQT